MRKLILAAAVSLLLAGCESQQNIAPAEPPNVPVIAAHPVIKDITVYLDSIGTLLPSVLMDVRPQVEGTLAEVLVTEGQWVQQGTPLFKIDSKPYAIKVLEAEAQLAIDRVNLQAAQKKLARYRTLAQKDLVPQIEWDALETEAERSQAALALDEARLNSARLDLERCTLQSSIKGRVGKLDAHPGLLVTRGQGAALATISQMDPLIVEFTVTEKEFPKVPSNVQQMEMKPLSSPESSLVGTITFLDNHFDPETGLLLIRAKVLNPDYALRPGQSVRVHIPISVTPNATLIPQKAIRYNQQGPYVYIVQSDKTVLVRQLSLGEEQGTDQIVLEGLESSESIVIDGHLRLSPGIKVEVKS